MLVGKFDTNIASEVGQSKWNCPSRASVQRIVKEVTPVSGKRRAGQLKYGDIRQ